MKSPNVSQLLTTFRSGYYQTGDLEHLKQQLRNTQQIIATTNENLDVEDHALLVHINHMVDYYEYGYIVPIEELDACVLAGHIPSIIYRIGQATLRPMSKDVEIYVRSAIEKIFRSGSERQISRLSDVLNYSYFNSNPLQISEDQAESFDVAATSYVENNTINHVSFGTTDIHVYNFSIVEWKKVVSVLTENVKSVLLDEFKESTFIQINKKMFIATKHNEDGVPFLAVFFRNTNIAEINMNTNRDNPFEELLNICLEIRQHVIEFEKDAIKLVDQVQFLSGLEETNPDVDWLNLPKNRFGIRSLLFSEKSGDSSFDFLDEA